MEEGNDNPFSRLIMQMYYMPSLLRRSNFALLPLGSKDHFILRSCHLKLAIHGIGTDSMIRKVSQYIHLYNISQISL